MEVAVAATFEALAAANADGSEAAIVGNVKPPRTIAIGTKSNKVLIF